MTEKLEQSTETSTLITANDSKPMTFGEKLVGLSFNPSVDQKVQRIKELAAKNLVNSYPTVKNTESYASGDLIRPILG